MNAVSAGRLPSSEDSVEAWIRSKVPVRGLAPKAAAVVSAAISHPARLSYGSVPEVAQLAGVNAATVTRTAQALGYEGWPPFQRELRARYLSHLSAPEVAQQHRDTTTPASASLRQDLDGLAVMTRTNDTAEIKRLASVIANAGRTYVLGDGSYAAVAMAMAHNARLAGYDVEPVVNGGADVANRLAQLESGDVVVVVSFWRLYESAVLTAEIARAKGAQVWVLTDAVAPALSTVASGVIVVPAEGVAFFPSMTAGLAVAQAVISELAAVDPDRTRASVAEAEEQWRNFSLLHRGERGRRGRS